MQISKGDAHIFFRVLKQLRAEAILDEESYRQIDNAVEIVPFDWRKLARYAFWTAIVSFVVAATTLFADQWFLNLIAHFFTAPAAAKMIASSCIATGFFLWGYQRRRHHPGSLYSNETLLLLGVLSTAAAAVFGIEFLNPPWDIADTLIPKVMLGLSIVYGSIALLMRARTVWFFALLTLGSWLGMHYGYGWGTYWLYLSVPMRLVIGGGILVGIALLIRGMPPFDHFYPITRNFGLFYLFIALWTLSIIGDTSDIERWLLTPKISLLHWSLLFGLASGISIWVGLWLGENAWRSYGLTFLFINLYTRFFEHFWHSMHKALFFALLGTSLWWVGRYAESQLRKKAK